MKKIAFLTNSVFTCGGEQRVVCIIANELAKHNSVTIYTEDSPDLKDNPYNLSSSVQVVFHKPFSSGLFVKAFRFLLRFPLISGLKNFNFAWKFAYYNRKLVLKLKNELDNKYDTVIAVSDRLSILLGFAKKNGLNSDVIGWEHNSFESYFRTPNHRLWKQDKLFISAAKNFSNCVVLNEDYVEKYKKYLGLDAVAVYNPRSFISEKKSTLDNKIIITCCVLDIEPKGLDLLLDSFEKFTKHNSDWKLQITGDGADREKIKQIAFEKNIQNRIEFLGYRTDIKELLLNASIFVLPSRWEGFPMALTEAYECGLATVFYDIPATIPFRRNGSALTCKSFDTNEFADSLLRLANDKDLRISLGRKAVDFSNSISIENIVQQWLKIV